MEQAKQGSALVLNQSCDSHQLLVTLCRNGKQWLSPVGWTQQEKGTLLDCQPMADGTKVIIPEEYAKDIRTGETLVLRCAELDFNQEIRWDKTLLTPKAPAERSKRGLFSRFSKTEEPVVNLDPHAETQRRAEEAARAADAYKAKMDAAETARIEAQKRAEEAARLAEEARLAEAERVAEMERAAKAFEEAERLRQDEKRRLEEELRIEEERRAEEARIAEEKRQREAAAKLARERQAKRDEIRADINKFTKTKTRLTTELAVMESDALKLSTALDKTQDRVNRIEGRVTSAREKAQKQEEIFGQSRTKLEGLQGELQNLNTSIEETVKNRTRLGKKLSQAEATYNKAKAELEAAQLRAEEKRQVLDVIRGEDQTFQEKITDISTEKDRLEIDINATMDNVRSLESRHKDAKEILVRETETLEALRTDLSDKQAQQQRANKDILSTKSEIETAETHISTQEEAYVKLTDTIETAAGTQKSSRAKIKSAAQIIPAVTHSEELKNDNSADDSGMLGRMRSAFSREKSTIVPLSPTANTEALDADLDIEKIEEEIAIPKRRGQVSLMVLAGLGLGGLVLFGTAAALNDPASPNNTIKQVFAKKTKAPVKSVSLTKIETKEEPTSSSSEISLVTPVKEAALQVDSTPLETASAEKLTPQSMSIELPNLSKLIKPEGHSSPEINKPKSRSKPAPEVKADVSKPAPKTRRTSPARRNIDAAPIRTTERSVSSTAASSTTLNRDVQQKLRDIGFYSGDINGQRDVATLTAVQDFKRVFGLPMNNDFSDDFLTNLDQSQPSNSANSLTSVASPSEIKVADLSGAPVLFDSPQSIPLEQSFPIAMEKPADTASEPPAAIDALPAQPVKTAEIVMPSPEITTAETRSNIVDPELLRSSPPKYPRKALSADGLVDVVVEIRYDVDAKGRVQNAALYNIDYTGRYSDAFRREAMKSVEAQRFSPRTIDGTPVATEGLMKRVIFRAQ
jgi:hypothetical protein